MKVTYLEAKQVAVVKTIGALEDRHLEVGRRRRTEERTQGNGGPERIVILRGRVNV
jgi:hypothetical protein